MKFRIVHRFPWPVERIKELLSTGEDLVAPDKLHNVSARKVLDFRKDGENFVRRCEWSVHGQIPKPAQKVVRPEMLGFMEETVWDHASGTFTSKITPHYFREIISVTSVSRWRNDGESTTVREYDGGIEIRVPVIGPLVERAIVDNLKRNCEQNAVLLTEALQTRLGEPER